MATEIPRWKKTRAAKQMRAEATPAEATLWRRLRNRGAGGFKFRRQQPLGDSVADFFCAEARLVVEIDGSIHLLKAGQDAARTHLLEEGGLAVLRFTNEAVLATPEDVVASTIAACEERMRLLGVP